MTTPDSPENPEQNPYGQTPENPYGQPPAQPNPYGQPSAPYGQTPQAPYGQQPYGQQPGMSSSPYPTSPPNHPSATTAMVLGIVSLVGLFVCFLPIFAAPFAWAMGRKAVREIDAEPGRYGGRDQANAGKIMGIIGTVLLALGLVFMVLAMSLMFIGTSSSVTYG